MASLEGFVRQVLGWREYVRAIYLEKHVSMRTKNIFNHQRQLTNDWYYGTTGIPPVDDAIKKSLERGYAHHIERLMILGNMMFLCEFHPDEVYRWFMEMYVDAYDWVMVPNVVGMALHADGGRMATKPYAAGGAYIDRMSDYCRGCRFDRTKRVGPDACPYTTLYWDFLARHAERFGRNPRMAQQVRAAGRLPDLPAVRERAVEVLRRLDAGEL